MVLNTKLIVYACTYIFDCMWAYNEQYVHGDLMGLAFGMSATSRWLTAV